MINDEKPLYFVGGAQDDLREMPRDVRIVVGVALYDAQRGEKATNAKPLKGFKGSGVLEVIANHDGDTFRAVYTVRLKGVVYVLHCFKKKSKKGIATPKAEIELINKRLKLAQAHYDENFEKKNG